MPGIDAGSLSRMRDALFFEGPDRHRRSSRFWVLLALAAVIASAGVVADSTATVIGAMIVAPLMTPILGIVLAITIGDRGNLVRSVALVAAGAAMVVAIAWVLGRIWAVPVVAATSSQVAGRVNPRIVDLVAALATGAVGAFALVRDDVGDALPGVAIAISLVPPLAVVGLALEGGEPAEARAAFLLFLTNVTAILVTGVIVMSIYRVRRTALATSTPGTGPPDAPDRPMRQRYPVLVVAVLLLLIAVPLVGAARRFQRTGITAQRVTAVADRWADAADWNVLDVDPQRSTVVVRVTGPEPAPDPQRLRRLLDADGLSDTSVRVDLVPEQRVLLPGR